MPNDLDILDKFVTASRIIHGAQYDYSLVKYINSKTKVSIICPIHGVFEKQPNKHLASRQGCPICGLARGSNSRRQGKDVFIAKAKELHGDKFIYGKVEYTNNSTKVTIGCPIHGDFEQIPNSHLLGRGCPICGGNLTLDTPEFIRRAKLVHGKTYDYSQSIYKSGRSKLLIICKLHGPFSQIAESHLIGRGCIKCSGNEKLNSESFIAMAKEVHDEKYDYSLLKYSGNKAKVKIICREHGLFEQQAKSHVHRGQGCPYCSNSVSIDFPMFLDRAKHRHGDKYEYSKAKYLSIWEPIEIICPVHGSFMQVPKNHISGRACQKCGLKSRSDMKRMTKESFIAKATVVHGDTYNYSESIYGGDNKSKLTIICNIHGEFKQSPNQHLRGAGCPKCMLPSDNDAIYIWKAIGQYFNGEQVYKVGVTSSRLLDKRIKYVARKANLDYEIIILRAVPGSAQYLESSLVKIGSNPQYSGHSGATEFRAYSESDLWRALDLIEAYIQQTNEIISTVP